MTHSLGLYNELNKKEFETVIYQYKKIDNRMYREEDEKAHCTIRIKHVDILMQGSINKAELLNTLMYWGVRIVNLYEAQIVRTRDILNYNSSSYCILSDQH